MKRQKNLFKIILTITGLMVLYIIFFPVSLTREAVMEPVWYKELTAADVNAQQNAAQDPVVPFKVGKLFGYVDLKGRLQHVGEVLYDVTLADKTFINYARLPENLVVQNTRGDTIANLPANGYPLLPPAGDKLFVITKDSMGIRQMSQTGQELWSAEFASLITSLSISKENVLIGLVNGKLKLFDNKGSLLYDAKMANSQMPVILGCALSDDGMKLAGVSGLHPQKLFFVQREKFNNPELFSTDLSTDFRRELLVKFAKNGNYFFFEQDNGLGVYDVKAKQVRYFKPESGLPQSQSANSGVTARTDIAHVAGLEELGRTGHLCLLLEKQNQTSFLIMQPVNLLFHHETIPYQHVFLKTNDNHLFIGLTNTETEKTEQEDNAGQAVTHTRTYIMQCDFYLM